MRSYIQGKIVAVTTEGFKDKESGEPIVYFTNVIKSSDGDLVTANSKKDFTEFEGQTGVCAIETSIKYNKDSGAFPSLKFSLREFSPGEELDTGESVLD